jgi:hypothetical protein
LTDVVRSGREFLHLLGRKTVIAVGHGVFGDWNVISARDNLSNGIFRRCNGLSSLGFQ